MSAPFKDTANGWLPVALTKELGMSPSPSGVVAVVWELTRTSLKQRGMLKMTVRMRTAKIARRVFPWVQMERAFSGSKMTRHLYDKQTVIGNKKGS